MDEMNIVKVNANDTVKGITYNTPDNVRTAEVLLNHYSTVYQVDYLVNLAPSSRLGVPAGEYEWPSYNAFYDDPYQNTNDTYVYIHGQWYGYFVGHLIDLSKAVSAVHDTESKSYEKQVAQVRLV